MKRKYSSIILMWVILMPGFVWGQKDFSISLYSGVFKMITNDEVQSPFIFKGSKIYFRTHIVLHGLRFSHGLQFSLSKPDLTAPITVDINGKKDKYMKSQFYTFRYSFTKALNKRKGIKMNIGPSLTARAGIRDFIVFGLSQISYEGMVSLEGVLNVVKQISPKGQANISIYAPLASFIIHRGYGLGDQENQVVGIGKLQIFELDLNGRFKIAKRFDFILGYDLLYYHYKISNEVRTANQQFYSGITLTF